VSGGLIKPNVSHLKHMDIDVDNQIVQASNTTSRPYRLAIVTSHPIQYFAPLFKRLEQHTEIDLTVLYGSRHGATPSQDTDFGVSFAWDIPMLEGYKYKFLTNLWPGRLRGFFSCLNPVVISEVRTGAYDAIIVFGWGHLTAWLAFAAAKFAGLPWMLYGDSVLLYQEENGRFKRLAKKIVLQQLFKYTGAFLVTGTFNRSFYEFYGAPSSKCFNVPLAVDNGLFIDGAKRARERRTEIRERYGIEPGAILILFVGKLIPRKRPQDLLAMLKNLQPNFPRLGVVFVGEGQLRLDLQACIAKEGLKNTFLLGFKNQTELPSIYAMSDVFALPSMNDPKPLVTNEAMACGLPVVVSHKTGVWGPGDIVRDGYNGFVYPCGDIGELARRVGTLAADATLREQMGGRSLEIIQSSGYEQCVGGILKALWSLSEPRQCVS